MTTFARHTAGVGPQLFFRDQRKLEIFLWKGGETNFMLYLDSNLLMQLKVMLTKRTIATETGFCMTRETPVD
jgi:hypothetical protein